MRINKGTGSSVNVVTEANRVKLNSSRPTAPRHRKNTPTKFTSKKEKAIGMPVSMRRISPPPISRSVDHHSMAIYPSG
jgi:hypothetical protein